MAWKPVIAGLYKDVSASKVNIDQGAAPQTLSGTFTFESADVTGLLSASQAQVTYDGSSGSYWDNEGVLSMTENNRPWDDLRVEPVARTTGANAPAFEKWYDDAAGTSRGVYLYSFDDAPAGSEKETFFTMQMPHDWDQSSITIHLHWVGAVDDTTANPRWGLEFAWKSPGEVFADTSIIYATSRAPAGADIVKGTHYISSFAVQTPGVTQTGLSSILIGRLFRDSANAGDTYDAAGAKCGLLYIDAHYRRNSLGSYGEYSKT